MGLYEKGREQEMAVDWTWLKSKREMIWREECKNRLTNGEGKREIGQASKNNV